MTKDGPTMTPSSRAVARGGPRSAEVILKVGAALAAVDGLSAILINRLRSPTPSAVRTFQGVAGALLGTDAFTGGLASMLLGVLMHVTVALTWAAVFVLAYRGVPSVRRWTRGWRGTAALGVPFGALIWARP